MADPGVAPKSLPLILARELASNLATPMFLMDAGGTLVFYNDAAELLIGKPFAELGEISAIEFGEVLAVHNTVVLFHHDPYHTDDELEALLAHSIEQGDVASDRVRLAHEGMTIVLDGDGVTLPA